MVLFAFGVGLANFASGRATYSPSEVTAAIAGVLPVVGSYGSTGNVVIKDGDVDETRRRLKTVTGKAWAVIGSGRLAEMASARCAAMARPEPTSTDERATPGLTFAVTTARGSARFQRAGAAPPSVQRHRRSVEAGSSRRIEAGPRSSPRRFGGGLHRHW